MAIDRAIDSAKLDTCLDAEADAIRAKTGGSADLAFDFANDKGFADAIASMPSGGTTINDGLVVVSRNGSGYPTALELYMSGISNQQFYNSSASSGAWTNVTAITARKPINSVKTLGFGNCGKLTSIPSDNTITSVADRCFQGAGIININLAKVSVLNGRIFSNCSKLENVTIGSIGTRVTNIASNDFQNCTQAGLTITVYTNGSYADAAVANIRNSATNAKIIIKASENTSYNAHSYTAGQTMLTSEVA